MKFIKVAGAVLNQTPLDWKNNQSNILHAIEEAKKQQAVVLCLPELCITGYGCEDAFYALGVAQTALEVLFQILPHTKNIAVNVGLPLWYNHRIFNTTALLIDGKLAGFYAKQFLAGSGIHYEPRWFTPFPSETVTSVTITHPFTNESAEYPLGDVFFDLNGTRIGFEICEDAWVASRPAHRLSGYGVDIVLNPSASHFAFDKLNTRKRFVIDGSRQLGCAYIYANLLGNEAGRAIYDGGVMIANNGELRAVYERLTFDDYKVSAAVIDLDKGHTLQAQNSDRNQLNTDNRRKINIDFTLPTTLPEKSIATDKSWESSIYIKEEEFARAFTLGLYDYMRKSRSKGFVISLSGGADSAAITAACRLMIEFGIESIGLEAFKNKLTYFPELSACKSADEISKMLIATAYQPTENSGQITQTAARELAKAIGAEFYIFDVNPVFKHYVDTLQSAIGRTLNWQQDDIALQNIQARVRAPSIWLLTNLRGALLLSTSNRSEAAVGYATMDGDTSGGLSPIAGIDKTFLRKWLVWLEKIGVDSHLRIPALSYINAQQPTAELRPPSSKQTDEQDLMPYEILNFIETAAIRDKKMPAECLVLLQFSYPDYEVEQLKTWIKKFFRLWCRNQWKRERYAPSFHFDDYNLDPRSWCRFPILSGGFEKELAEL